MNAADYLLKKSYNLKKDFVVGTKENISYVELSMKVNSLAAYIIDEVGSGREILLLSQNNLFFIISYLAIIKSGNKVVLVEAEISDKELESIFNKCSIRGVFIQNRHIKKVKDFKQGFANKIFTESILDQLTTRLESKLTTGNNEDDVVLIIFTSGSTGEKKGVMLTHKNIKANTESIIKYLRLTENDRMEVVLPFFYSYGLSLLHTHLRVGASMVLNQSIFIGSIIKEINQYQCTGFAGVPSTYQILINKTNFLEEDFPSIRYFTQAGGKLPDKYIQSIHKSFPEKLFFVMYGATEATARLSYLPPKLIDIKLGSIGKGIPGVLLKVVDFLGKKVKPGEIGEIVAVGDNIMKGYYKDDKSTEKVIKNGILYTRDLAKVDEDGYIYVVGRANSMIKSAGHKVFPSEIEVLINSMEGVLDCYVFGIPDAVLGEAVVVAVLTKEPSHELEKEIFSFCHKNFPSYKVPRRIRSFSKFPLNSSNKKDLLKIKEIVNAKINNE